MPGRCQNFMELRHVHVPNIRMSHDTQNVLHIIAYARMVRLNQFPGQTQT